MRWSARPRRWSAGAAPCPSAVCPIVLTVPQPPARVVTATARKAPARRPVPVIATPSSLASPTPALASREPSRTRPNGQPRTVDVGKASGDLRFVSGGRCRASSVRSSPAQAAGGVRLTSPLPRSVRSECGLRGRTSLPGSPVPRSVRSAPRPSVRLTPMDSRSRRHYSRADRTLSPREGDGDDAAMAPPAGLDADGPGGAGGGRDLGDPALRAFRRIREAGVLPHRPSHSIPKRPPDRSLPRTAAATAGHVPTSQRGEHASTPTSTTNGSVPPRPRGSPSNPTRPSRSESAESRPSLLASPMANARGASRPLRRRTDSEASGRGTVQGDASSRCRHTGSDSSPPRPLTPDADPGGHFSKGRRVSMRPRAL